MRSWGLLPMQAAEAGAWFGEVAAAVTFGRCRRAPFPLIAWSEAIACQHDLDEVGLTGRGVQRLVRRQQHLSLGGRDDDDDLRWRLPGLAEVLDVVRRGELTASVRDRVVRELEAALTVHEADAQVGHGSAALVDDTTVHQPLLWPRPSHVRATQRDVVDLLRDVGEERASFFEREHPWMLGPELGLETAPRRIQTVGAGRRETPEPPHERRAVVGEVRRDLVLEPGQQFDDDDAVRHNAHLPTILWWRPVLMAPGLVQSASMLSRSIRVAGVAASTRMQCVVTLPVARCAIPMP